MIKCTFESGRKTSLRHAVVDTLVLKGDTILMVKRGKGHLEEGKWALVSGFIDRDETVNQAVAREIMEETGYEVSNINLLTINDNPDRPHEDRQNISFVFYCNARKQVKKPDKKEIDDLCWFSFSELPDKSDIAFDHFYDIQTYLKFKNKGIKPALLR